MTQIRLIFRNAKLTLIIWILFPLTLIGQSTWIYGIQKEGAYTNSYLVRLNYLNGQYDTVFYLGDQNIDDFGSCIDPFNGRLFLSGLLFGQDGFLHEIDLNSLEIVSYDKQYYGRKIEYNLLNNSIIYRVDNTFWELDLETQVETKLSNLEPTTGNLWGDPRNYNPIDNTYVWIAKHGDIYDFTVINAFTGEEISKTPANITLFSLVVDYDSGKHYGEHNGTIYEFNPYSGEIIELLSIPGYTSHLNQQECAYDQVNKKYIIPYIGPYSSRLITVIDMVEYTIDTTYDQPNSKMDLHEIYCMPRTYLSLINDTLYTSFGQSYQWYINGYLNPFVNTQYFSPSEYGEHQTLVDYPEYSSLSNPVTYLSTDLQTVFTTNEVNVVPNPFYNNVKITGNTEYWKESTISVFNSIGDLVYNSCIENSVIQDLEFLEPGLYIFIIEKNDKHLLRKKMIKSN